jgi:hypothetical protein
MNGGHFLAQNVVFIQSIIQSPPRSTTVHCTLYSILYRVFCTFVIKDLGGYWPAVNI